MSINPSSLKTIAPRHVEIMERLLSNQSQLQIANEMGVTQARLSIIMNSPLFKLELRKRQIRREEKFLQMEESILEGALTGVKKLKTIAENDNPLHTREAMQSSIVLTNLGVKMMDRNLPSPSNGGGNGGSQSYEELLQKVTVEQSHRKITHLTREEEQLSQEEIESNLDGILDQGHPPLLDVLEAEEEASEELDSQLREEVKKEMEEESSPLN